MGHFPHSPAVSALRKHLRELITGLKSLLASPCVRKERSSHRSDFLEQNEGSHTTPFELDQGKGQRSARRGEKQPVLVLCH